MPPDYPTRGRRSLWPCLGSATLRAAAAPLYFPARGCHCLPAHTWLSSTINSLCSPRSWNLRHAATSIAADDPAHFHPHHLGQHPGSARSSSQWEHSGPTSYAGTAQHSLQQFPLQPRSIQPNGLTTPQGGEEDNGPGIPGDGGDVDPQPAAGRPSPPGRLPITDLSKWIECYSLMAATLALAMRFPDKAPELFAYQASIVRAERNYEAGRWVAYDR